MSVGVQRFCAWSGPVFCVVFFAGVIMAGLLPPPSPSETTAEVAQRWSENTDLKRVGLLIMMISTGFQIPFAALLAVRMKRMEGRWSPLSYVVIAASATAVVAILVAVFVFAACSFRPERDPEIIQMMWDFGWLGFVMNWPPAVLQCVALAAAILGDKNRRPVLPRWVAYYNLWTAFLFLPGGFCIFFKSGAFAWNGLLAF